MQAILKQVASRKSENLIAIGINCIHPSFVSTLLKSAKAAIPEISKPFVVYPNSGKFTFKIIELSFN